MKDLLDSQDRIDEEIHEILRSSSFSKTAAAKDFILSEIKLYSILIHSYRRAIIFGIYR